MTAKPGPEAPDGHLGPTRVRDLVLLGAAVAVLTWVFTAYNFRDFPVIAWYTGAILLVLAATEAIAAAMVKRRVAENEVGQAREQLHPVAVARLVALAKASAILGAVAVGAWGAVSVYLFTLDDVTKADLSKPGTIIGTLGGVALVVAALWLEQCCKTPDDPTEDGQVADPDAA